MAENEENQKQPIAESHQEVKIEIVTRRRIRRHKQLNRDYETDKPIKSRNYGRKKAIRQRNFWKRS